MATVFFRGFTLFEWLITVAVVAVSLAVSIPGFIQHLARTRLAGAAEAIAGDLQLARSEAIRRGTPVYVQLQPGNKWCTGLHTNATCDCTNTDPSAESACTLATSGTANLNVTTGSDYPGITLAATSFRKNHTSFDPVRGTARPGTVRLQGYQGAELRVVLSMLGRVRICTAPGSSSNGRYPLC